MKNVNNRSESLVLLGGPCSDPFWYLSLRPSQDMLGAFWSLGSREWSLLDGPWAGLKGREEGDSAPPMLSVRLWQELTQAVVSILFLCGFCIFVVWVHWAPLYFPLKRLCLAQLNFWNILFRERNHQKNKRKACEQAGNTGLWWMEGQAQERVPGSSPVCFLPSFSGSFQFSEEWLLIGRDWVSMPRFTKGS